jgi:hypothetical protein
MPIHYYQMTADGPVVDALIGVSAARMAMLQATKQPIPNAVPIRMLIDTGASGCCVNAGLLSPLGLNPTGIIAVHTPTTGGAPVNCNQFDVGILIPHPQSPFFVPVIPVMECQPLFGNIQGLLGRDVLSICQFIYIGPVQGFSLAF